MGGIGDQEIYWFPPPPSVMKGHYFGPWKGERMGEPSARSWGDYARRPKKRVDV